ncbi:TolC family outer membrane protein [Cupriavidus sp. IDO]|uniref:TolC family outer membrane protein n=1 Tax=Cupriavidus sp. IDO TaxID=1539142 RepID=UPI00057914E6|nr:TolC family outer membrane protein [Cupriavidus sp. IDO]KWR75298.1 channel protein TolC [Cupriavidus sp. IDO]
MEKNRPWPRLAAMCLAAVLVPAANAQTLQEAVEQAVRTNPDVLATTYHRLAADQGLKQARAGYLPRVDVGAGIGRERLDSTDTRILGLSETDLTRKTSSLTLTQMLFDGFAVKSSVEGQKARVASSAYNVGATAEDIALRTVAAYLEVLRREDNVSAAGENLQAHQRIYEQIKERSEGGVGRRADLYQAQSRLALAQDYLRSEEGGLQDARTAYVRLVGAPPSALVKPPSLAQALPPTEAAALNTAMTNHPALKAAQADVDGAEALHSAAKAGLWPRLDLELAVNHDRPGPLGPSHDRSAMLRLRYNIFRGGADVARISETASQTREAEEALKRTQRQVQESLSLAFNAYLTSRERLTVLKQYVNSGEATREAYALQFSVGRRTLLDLLNAENEYYNARITYLSGQYAELASQYRLFAGMGQLLDTLQIALPIEAAALPGAR